MRELLSYTIEVGEQKAVADLQKVDRAFEQLGTQATQTGQQIDAAAAKNTKSLNVLEQSYQKHIDKRAAASKQVVADMTREAEAAAKAQGSIRDQASKTDTALASLGRRIVAVFAVERIVSFAASVIQAGSKVQDLSDKTGLSTTAIQKFGYAANLTGSNIDAVASAIGQMSKNLVGGNDGAVEALNRLGLSQKALMAMDPERAFLEITDAIKQIKDPMKQADAAMRIFGRGGAELLPAIKNGFTEAGDEAERLGLIMSGQTVKALDDAGDAWTRVWQGMTVWTGRVLAAVFQVTDALGRMYNAVPAWMKNLAGGATSLSAWNIFQTGLGMSETSGVDVNAVLDGTANGLRRGGLPIGAIDGIPGFSNTQEVSAIERQLTDQINASIKAGKDANTATQKAIRELAETLKRNAQLYNLKALDNFQQTQGLYGMPAAGPNYGMSEYQNDQDFLLAYQWMLSEKSGQGLIPSRNPVNNFTGPNTAASDGASYIAQQQREVAKWQRESADFTAEQQRQQQVDKWYGMTMPQFGRWDSRVGAVAGGAMQGMQAIDGAMNVWNATDVAGRGNRAWAGAKAGAQAGAMFGPYGALIGMGVGALIGALRNPGFEQEMKRVAKDFGVNISEQLARSIDKLKKAFGGDRQAAEIFSLDAIIKEGGGVNEKNVDQLIARFRDVFVMLDQGKFSLEQATEVIDKNWSTFLEASTDSAGNISRELKEIIALNERFGTQSKEIAAFLKDQGLAAAEAFNAVSLVAATSYDAFAELKFGVDQATLSVKALEAAGKAGTSEWLAATQKLREATEAQAIAADGARQQLTDLTTIATGSVFAAVAAGATWAEAIGAAGPGIDRLVKAYKDLGMPIDDPLLKILETQRAIQTGAPHLLEAVGGLQQTIVSLNNMGMLNAETFASIGRTGYDAYVRIQGQVAAVGGSTRDALLPMQTYLQQAEKAARDLGIPLDDNTRMMIDQSRELGIWKELGKTPTEKLTEGMTLLVEKVTELINTMLGIPSTAETVASGVEDAFNGLDIRVPIHFDPENIDPNDYRQHPYDRGTESFANGGVVYAAGGWPRPRGTDTVPAMLTPGEGVLSRRGMAMLGTLNGGKAGGGADAQAIGKAMAQELMRSGGLRPTMTLNNRILTEEVGSSLHTFFELEGIKGPTSWQR